MQDQIDNLRFHSNENRNRMSQIEESLMNAKKLVNGMGKKCNQIVANFDE